VPAYCSISPGYNPGMKVWIVLLSLLAAACVWRWGSHRHTAAGWRRRGKQIAQSMAAGVAVYFSIMAVALLYLMLTRP